MALKDLLDNVEKSTSEKEKVLKSIGQNFMALSGIARDLNVAGQNLAVIIEGRGESAAKKQDAFFLKEEEREKKLEVELGKDKGVTQVTSGKKKKSFFELLKDMLKPGKIFKILVGVLALGVIVKLAFDNFKDAIVEKFKDVGNMIKEKFTEWTKKIKEWFLETVTGLKDKAAGLYEKFTDGIGNFFKGVVEKVTSVFSKISNKFMEFISPVLDIFKSGYEKFKGAISSITETIKSGIKNFIKVPGARKFVPNAILKFAGIPLTKSEIETEEKEQRAEIRKRLKEEGRLINPTGDLKSIMEQEGVSKKKAIEIRILQRQANKRLIDMEMEKERKARRGPPPKGMKYLDEEAKDQTSPTTKPTSVSEDPAKDKPVTKVTGEDDIKAMIIEHEGIRYEPYKDSVGLWTIGVGHLIGDGKSLPDNMNRTFSEKEVMDMFEEDYAHHKEIASRTPGYNEANYAGKAAMIDLGFNMGKWWPKWPNTSKALKEGDFTSAARGLEDSKWYRQVGRRAPKIVALIESAATKGPSGGDIASGSSSIDAGHSQQRKPKTPVIVNNISNNNRNLTVENTVFGKDKSKTDPSLRYT